MKRSSRHVYLDPLDAIWLTVAARIGFQVRRSEEVYASTDGRGIMTIGDPSTLDPDDCLAQMILHELCHSLIEGAQSLREPDFGLDNESERDVVREHACLRLQARLTAEYGLRRVLAPTTDFRSYYDALPEDPFEGADPAIALATGDLARDGLRDRRVVAARARIAHLVAAALQVRPDGVRGSQALRVRAEGHTPDVVLQVDGAPARGRVRRRAGRDAGGLRGQNPVHDLLDNPVDVNIRHVRFPA